MGANESQQALALKVYALARRLGDAIEEFVDHGGAVNVEAWQMDGTALPLHELTGEFSVECSVKIRIPDPE